MRIPRGCEKWLRLARLLAGVALAVATGLASAARPTPPTPRRLSQGQAAGHFLRAVLRADYPTAYGRLAPEVRRSVSPGQFAAAARPLWKSGARHAHEIELYKLGIRLSEGGGSQLFYSFSFAAESGLKLPSVLLEVTFRDTASRAILGFGVRRVAARVPAGRLRR